MSACFDAVPSAQSVWAIPVTPSALKLDSTSDCTLALLSHSSVTNWLGVRVEPLIQCLSRGAVQRLSPLGVDIRHEPSRVVQATRSVPWAVSAGSGAAAGAVRREAS